MVVTAKDLRRLLRSLGCVETRQRGSHLRVECGQCVTTVPVHAGEDIGPGLLRRIQTGSEQSYGLVLTELPDARSHKKLLVLLLPLAAPIDAVTLPLQIVAAILIGDC